MNGNLPANYRSTTEVLRVGPFQCSTTWLGLGVSLVVHVGGVWGLGHLAHLPGSTSLPSVQYAQGQAPLTVQVNFITAAQLEAMSRSGPVLKKLENLESSAAPPQQPAIVPAALANPVPTNIVPTSTTPTAPTPEPSHTEPTTEPLAQAMPPREPQEKDLDEGVERGAQILHLPRPKYPPLSRRLGEEGVVLLEVEVLPNGSAGAIRILANPGYPRLTAAAIAAVRLARFHPGLRRGVPVRTVVKVPFEFVLR